VANIKPFKALVYDSDKIKDYADVVCPPYDVISEAEKAAYYGRSEQNLIHVLLPEFGNGKDKYQHAAEILKSWIKEGVLKEEEKPAVYFYSQQYSIRGEKKTRLGFISLLHLGENGCAAFAHENTRQAPKDDRFNLIKQVKANLSPIFVIFQDKKRIIQRIFQKNIDETTPLIKVTDNEKTIHKLWKIDSPELISALEKALEKENIFIADGHHRFEVACNYRELMRSKLGSLTGEEDFNYIMTYFTNTDARGLSILPTHRLLKLNTAFNFEEFKDKLNEYFEVEEIKDKIKFFLFLEKCSRSEHVIGISKNAKYWLLRLKNIKILDRMIPGRPKEYRSLDAAILNTIIFKHILGFDPEEKGIISYNQNAEEFISATEADSTFIAFFLNPVKIEQVIAVATVRDKMPPKSTYFYPKVLSGLLINKFKD
jgi:uncharacterized protein (DUF1015 family)